MDGSNKLMLLQELLFKFFFLMKLDELESGNEWMSAMW